MRHYLIGSWNNADEFDYSGEQLMGSRADGRSTKLDDIMPHVLPNGKANLLRYADAPSKSKRKSKQEFAQDLLYQINPDEKKLDSLDEKEQALTTAYVDGLISGEQYEKALETLIRKRYAIHKKMAKEGCEDMPQWIEEHGTYEDKKKLYNSKSYGPSLQVQSKLLATLKPKETTFNKIINWLRNN